MIIHDGLRRMVTNQEDVFYYITLMNENYEHPAMPQGAEEGILKGLYLLQRVEIEEQAARAAARFRHHPARSGGGRGAAGKRLGRRRRRVERDQLHRAAPRRPCRRALEPAASRKRKPRVAVRDAMLQNGQPARSSRRATTSRPSPSRSGRSCRRAAPTTCSAPTASAARIRAPSCATSSR